MPWAWPKKREGENLSFLSFFLFSFFFFFFSFFLSVFLGLYLQHMEVPRLGVESELQLPDCATATAVPDLS